MVPNREKEGGKGLGTQKNNGVETIINLPTQKQKKAEHKKKSRVNINNNTNTETHARTHTHKIDEKQLRVKKLKTPKTRKTLHPPSDKPPVLAGDVVVHAPIRQPHRPRPPRDARLACPLVPFVAAAAFPSSSSSAPSRCTLRRVGGSLARGA